MKQIYKSFIALMILLSMSLTSCSLLPDNQIEQEKDPDPIVNTTTVVNDYVMVEGVDYSQGFDESTEGTDPFNKDIFYRNDLYFGSADPAVIRCDDVTDTENYGKFFLFATDGAFGCYESTDLANWTPKAPAYVWDKAGWQLDCGWAPEVIWDEFADPADYGLVDTDGGKGVYFMFCSANPVTNIEANAKQRFQLALAVATCPYGPYITWTGVERGAVIDGVDYGTEAGYATYTNYASSYAAGTYTGYVGREGNEVTINDSWWNSPASSASLNYQYNHRDLAGKPDPDNNNKIVNKAAAYMVINEGHNGSGGVWFSCIDPTPFLNYNEMIEVDGVLQPKKYLFFTRDKSIYDGATGEDGKTAFYGTCLYAVSFVDNDWAQVDYSTLTRITRTKYNFTSQAAADAYVEAAKAFDASKYESGYQEISPDATSVDDRYNLGIASTEEYIRPNGKNNINEGAQLTYNEETGLYYLTTSIGQYKKNTYSVIQLVAYDIMGPYRKLEMDEGGLMLATNKGISIDNMTGTGHHSMFKCGDELLIVYHRHLNISYSGDNRGYCLDRVSWVKNNDGLTIMHVNGPTASIQPLIYGTGATEYDIISDEATVTTTATSCNDVKYLTDSIIRFHTDNIQSHITEFGFSDKEATITLSYSDYRDIVALQIFNSRDFDSMFKEIYKIEMDVKINGLEGTVIINNLKFDFDNALFASGDNIRPCHAATAVFSEMAIKEIRITVKNENADSSGSVVIPEIYVIGKPLN